MKRAKSVSTVVLTVMTLMVCWILAESNKEDGNNSRGPSNVENSSTESATTPTTTTPRTVDFTIIPYRGSASSNVEYANQTGLNKYLQLLCMQVNETDAILGVEGSEWESIDTLKELQQAVMESELVKSHSLIYEEGLYLEEVIDLFRKKNLPHIIVHNQVNGENFILKGGVFSEEDPNFFTEFMIYDKSSKDKSESYSQFIVNHDSNMIIEVETISKRGVKLTYHGGYKFDVMYFE